MEEVIEIHINDNLVIDGTLNYMSQNKKNLIIFVHGLADNKNHRIVYNASKFFRVNNFHTFRFSLYSGYDDGRFLENCDFEMFINDINLVLNYFRGKYENIFLVGHSLGYLILKCNLDGIRKIALWEPSCDLYKRGVHFEYDKRINKYFMDCGVRFFIDKKLKEDWENIDDISILQKLRVPTAFFVAEKSSQKDVWKEYVKSLNVEYEFIVIKNASHGFYQEGVDDDLYKQTLDWFLD